MPQSLTQLQWAFFISAMLFLLARLHNVMVFRGPGALDMHVRLGLAPCMLCQAGLGSVHVTSGWAGVCACYVRLGWAACMCGLPQLDACRVASLAPVALGLSGG